MRHAKSDWSDSSLADFDRPLNSRGKKAAPFMGNELLKRKKIPDLIISSPANRAKSTAKKVAEAVGYKNEIQFEKDFYFGYIDEIIEILKRTDNQNNTILIFGHNPTFESLVSVLSENSRYVRMPTAAVASILFEIDDWSALKKNTGKLEWLISPKELMG
jgi:phosphohistidine phosphatase